LFEPVKARPPSTVYRLRKLVRKNAGVVTSIAALFVLLAAGVVTSTSFYLSSEEKRVEAEEARKEADLQKTAAIVAQGKEADQRRQAEEKEQLAREREKEAIAARQEAERQRKEVLRLADIKRLQELVAEAGGLWPAHPEKIRDMESWRNRARVLAANLDTHRTSLLALRELAVERPEEPETPDDGQQASGVGSEDGAAGDEDMATDSETETSDAPATPGRWVFADTETQWRHDVLTELVAGLATFIDPDPRVGMMAGVDERLVFARSVREKTVGMYDVEWKEAIASIANEEECPAYKGLVIAPQLGLIPLGRDPASSLWEFAHLQTGEIPYRDEEHLVIDKETGLVFVLIPGGSFLMGAQKEDPEKPNYDPQAEGAEGPVHGVTLSPFFLSKYEMTQGQWERFVGKNPSSYQSGELVPRPGLHPVEQVSWEDCQGVMERLRLVLPTEAQWEHAARAGATTPWWTGTEKESLDGAANLADAYCKRNGGPAGWAYEEWLDDGFVVYGPVGSLRANAFGLHDVIGNVWEWCRDSYGGYDSPVAPGDGERQVSSRDRVFRGGGFYDPASFARSAIRFSNSPGDRYFILGLRPARVITE
jgi:formylglycine-generating enzyme required for sulfatase activity